MKSFAVLAILALSGCTPQPLSQGRPNADIPARGRAEIPFVSYGTIEDWHAEGDRAVTFRTANNHYYRATFMSPCLDLPYAQHIGLATGGTDTLDKFDSIVVHGRQCFFDSFTEIPKPPYW